VLPHQRLIERGVVTDDRGNDRPLVGNVSTSEADRIYRLVREAQPEVSIEIGLACGVSSLAIVQALADNGCGRHYIVDPFQRVQWGGAGLRALHDAGLDDRVEFHEAFPEEAVPTLPRASFAFIDASHLFDLTLLDFVLVDKRLDPGGLLGFHDSGMPSVGKALRYILTNRAYRVHEPVPLTAGSRRKSRLSKALQHVPRASRVLRPEVLTRTAEFGVQANMAFLEKLRDDDRDWQDHVEF
jgi:hypothetical protein